MKRNHRILAAMLIVISLLTLLPTSALAAYKVKALQYDTWYKLTDSSSNMTIYRFKVTTDTVITISWRNYQDADNFAYGAVYRDKNCQNILSYDTVFPIDGAAASGKIMFVAYPGTYYLRMYDEAGKEKVKVSKQTVKSINKTNYSIRTAINLKKGIKAKFAQTKKDFYTRWYKIKLTQRQVISIYGYGGDYELYDINFNQIRCDFDYENRVIKTVGKQPVGTYYLALRDYISDLLKYGHAYQIYWK